MAKIKGKNWFEVIAPKFLKSKVLGETPAVDSEDIVGRIIEASVLDLTGDPGKYYLKLFFKIDSIDGGRAVTKFVGHTSTKDFLARIVQMRTSRIDTNDVIETKDGKLRVKSISICNRRVTKIVAKALRAKTTEMLKSKISELAIEEFVPAMVDGTIQNEIHSELKKIYPIRVFEIRATEVL